MKQDDWVLNQSLVRKLLESRYSSQREAAAAMGMAHPNLNRTLNGSPNVTIAVIGRLADALDVPITKLLVRAKKQPKSDPDDFRKAGGYRRRTRTSRP